MAREKSLAFALRRRVDRLPCDVIGNRQSVVRFAQTPETCRRNKPARAELMKFQFALLLSNPGVKLRKILLLPQFEGLAQRN